MAYIKLENLTKRFGENTVVNRVNLEIPNGTLVSILGPSGCGKTTLLRMIAGFETPDEGNIFFDQESVVNVPANKRNIGMVFQSYALFPHMTVEENVAYGLQQRKLNRAQIEARVEQVINTVHLDGFRKRKPKQLSGGQQQRVALARALAISPRVLLLDECLSALDKKLRVEMQTELRKILEESKVTTFFVTHDQEEAMTLSDFIVVMDNGVIEQMGTPLEVYEKPKNQFVASFLGKANFFRREDGSGFAVRPEKIQLSAGEPAAARPESGEPGESAGREQAAAGWGGAVREGVITFISYSGNITAYTIECAGEAVLCEKQNVQISENLKKGQKVYLSWEKESEIELTD
ncbi:MAG TPA: ABC transporter ATP-binding protein [Anaerovoracaceae bacterium]|nr:ABC transporter ATP-binding protein [Anaerovoracaceae bacterium]